MKRANILLPKLLLACGLMMVFNGLVGQSFEGTVSYNVRVTGKDAQDYLVNTPPTGITMHVKEDNFIVKLTGGRIARTFLFIGDSNHTYIVDIPNKRYFRRTYFADTTGYVPVAKPTGKTLKVKGYPCQEYQVKRRDRKEIDLFYINPDFKVDTTLYSDMDGAKADFLVPGLGGHIPLMKVIKTPTLVTSIELGAIKPDDFPIEAFRIPYGFSSKRKRDPRK